MSGVSISKRRSVWINTSFAYVMHIFTFKFQASIVCVCVTFLAAVKFQMPTFFSLLIVYTQRNKKKSNKNCNSCCLNASKLFSAHFSLSRHTRRIALFLIQPSRRTDGRTDEQMDGRTDERTKQTTKATSIAAQVVLIQPHPIPNWDEALNIFYRCKSVRKRKMK